MLDIQTKYKTIWDKDRFSPLSPDAAFLAMLCGTKTLSRKQLKICKLYGCKVTIQNMDVDQYLSIDYEEE